MVDYLVLLHLTAEKVSAILRAFSFSAIAASDRKDSAAAHPKTQLMILIHILTPLEEFQFYLFD
jgi:hypothetical protein